MTNVPRSVMSGKSPMKTVWLLISPVTVFMNSSVTKSGASYVWSRSLQDSIVLRVSSKRWSRNESDIEPEKSSIGEISSKISSRPERSGTSVRPASLARATRACQRSLPSSQSKLSVWRARRSGTSRGSRIWANDRRPEAVRAVDTFWDAVREAAKEGPSTGLTELELSARPAPVTSGTWLGAATWSGHGSHREGSPRTPGLGNRSGHHEALERTEVAGRGSAKRQHTREGLGCPVESSFRPRAPARSP